MATIAITARAIVEAIRLMSVLHSFNTDERRAIRIHPVAQRKPAPHRNDFEYHLQTKIGKNGILARMTTARQHLPAGWIRSPQRQQGLDNGLACGFKPFPETPLPRTPQPW
jgi:hypothetical protein